MPELGRGPSPIPGAAAAPPGKGPGLGGPTPSPLTTPEPMEGLQKGARIQVQVASQMLQRELPHFPLESDEFKAISDALRGLSKVFGKTQDEDRKVFPAEVMSMLAAVGPDAGSPGQKALAGGPPMIPPGAAPAPSPA